MLLALVHNIIANINGESPMREKSPSEMCNHLCENPVDLLPHILGFHILPARKAYGDTKNTEKIRPSTAYIAKVHYEVSFFSIFVLFSTKIIRNAKEKRTTAVLSVRPLIQHAKLSLLISMPCQSS